ncbi:IS110 family transposase, partial [Xenorhabdus bovienii]|nr:IS110 family transposase [Xenorhabdus bovienii]
MLVEQGIVIPAGIQQLRHALPDILEEGNNALSFVLRRLLHSLQEDMQRFDVRIYDMDKEIQAVS